MKKLTVLCLLVGCFVLSCRSGKTGQAVPLAAERFDTVLNGQTIRLFTLTNESGMIAQITNYGGRVVALWAPDRDGNFRDVVQGFDNIADYIDPKSGNQGATVGRYANRIFDRRFALDSAEYLLSGHPDAQIAPVGVNDFNRAVFSPRTYTNDKGEQALELKYLSPDGETGFPGNVDVTVTFTLTARNGLQIHYGATTDRPTVVSMTNHSFFNLNGEGNGDILGHELRIDADKFLWLKEGTFPTGDIVPVEDTPVDFRTSRPIGERIDDDYIPLNIGDGYDLCYVFNAGEGINRVASLYAPESGIRMDVFTNQPGMQLYTGNKLNGLVGKQGHVYERRSGVCLETMSFPDSPNHPNFPSTVLRPGEVYDQTCMYEFGVD